MAVLAVLQSVLVVALAAIAFGFMAVQLRRLVLLSPRARAATRS